MDTILNAILVQEGIRPAMLVQPADYKEATEKDPKTASILRNIKKHFPHLIHSSKYEVYQGIIISKNKYNGNYIDLTEMGKILGYPCYKDFNMDRNEITYAISIYIRVNNVDYEIITNSCKTKEKHEFDAIANRIRQVLPKYVELIGEVQSVTTKINTIIPTQSIIHKLIHNLPINKEHQDAIQNIWFNFGFSIDFQFFFIDNFQYKNQVHRGILLSLLMMEKNYTLSPFFPLQEHPAQDKQVNEILHAWELELMDVIKKTQITGTTVLAEVKCAELGRELNPTTKRCDKKCNPSQTRRKRDFKCVHKPKTVYEKIKFWSQNL
jgi:hypothetical protein